ncbi:MAG TPA: ATP-binding protein [Mucilaginibacter sp.]|jgi:signal transduction histidine kinase|nr:ATP-binding protein [Mucilaginibacter sp.]
MKKIYLHAFLLFIITTSSFAQTAHVFNLNKLSQRDTLVSGWVFHAGDNADWSKPDADDKGWKAVDPSIDVAHFAELKNAGIGWLRVHVRVDSSLANKTLAVSITQYTASEIYLNGTPLVKYGIVSANPAKVEGYLPSKQPFIMKLVPGKDNIIAVRIAYQRGLPYLSSLFEQLSAFAMYINNYHSAVVSFYDYQTHIKNFILVFSLFGGMVSIVFFTYIVYFLFDRKKRIYLYYALFCLSICYITLPNEIYGVDRFGPLATEMWAVYAEGAGFVLGMIFLLLTVYTIFNYQKRIVFTILSAIAAIMVVLMYFNGTTFFFVNTSLIPLLFMFEGVHVCIWAIKNQKKDAAYVLVGIVSFVLLIGGSSLLDQGTILAQLLWGAGIVCFPLGMAFYLGVQSSITNKRLAASLDEVQTLSKQKQQILADQNIVLERQVTERTKELNTSLENLKAAQSQLIQSEKMASLGELTAGIAHEIQNPLNFVNNFSEVSIELLTELREEEKKGNKEDVIAIADDLSQNLDKIRHHGKRADAIVKGMLQHSQASSGQKEPTDLNALAEEYLRLAYHGLRAKDKDFNAELIKHFDEDLPKINVIPRDIGRVLLNVINNAFYTTQQRAKIAGTSYKPKVEISTAQQNSSVIISVKDNGNGIPDAIKDKIMQPFFTTKPTGEGTGLGLSLSYDIVVKGHGGNIQVDSTEGTGSAFAVQLPIK